MIREKVYTVGLVNGLGPAAYGIKMQLVDQPDLVVVEAWIGNFGSSNAYLFPGLKSVLNCQQALANDADTADGAFVDCLMCLTGAGPTKVELDSDLRHLTVFFEAANSSGQTQAVTFKVRETVC